MLVGTLSEDDDDVDDDDDDDDDDEDDDDDDDDDDGSENDGKKMNCVLSNLIASIWICSICQIQATFPGVEFLRILFRLKKMKGNSS